MAAADYSTVVQQLYIAYFGRPADPQGLFNFQKALDDAKAPTTISGLQAAYNTSATVKMLVDAFGTSAESQALYTGSTLDFVNAIYQNIFNRPADVEGLLYWTNAITVGGLSKGNAAASIMAAAQVNTTAQGVIDAAIVAKKVSVASNFTTACDTTAEILAYQGNTAAASARGMLSQVNNTTDVTAFQSTVNATLSSLGTVVGNTFELGVTRDGVVGTAGDDKFYARIFDNQNTLQSGDKITGGAGNDRLEADVGNSQKFAITAETTGVEQVAIRAQAIAVDSGNNNPSQTKEVQIDAQRMSGVNHWESNNSRADLIIEDVRILDSQITKDITIAMVETDPGHVDFGVYFDQYSLRAQTNASNVLRLQLMDTRSNAAGTGPLKDSPYNGFAFFYKGVLTTVTSPAIDAALTYTELFEAIKAAVAATPGLSNVVVSLGGSFTVNDTLGTVQTGTEIVLTTTNGDTIGTSGPGAGWVASGAVPPSSGLHTNMSTLATTTTDLVTAKIILDDVGRGSTGGDLVVGGLSVGDTSTSLGVQRFEIEVRDNSKLQTINSTNNTLREVTIKNGVTSSNSHAYVSTTKDSGDLTVLGTVGTATGINAPLPGTTNQHNAFGFSDVRLIDASAMTGKFNFNAEVTTASIAKYLNLRDGQVVPSADNVAFVYNGGSNNDSMTVLIDSAVAASSTLSGREDFTFTIDGGAGNDSISVDIGGLETGPWLVNQKLLQNITVNGGAGNDTIRTPGAGSIRINAGEGNDTVYTDNTGTVGATWLVSAANTDETDLQSSVATGTGRSFLYKGKLTVAFSGAGGVGLGGGVTAGAADAVAANFTNGFEVVVDIPTGENFAVTQYHINQAIKTAINGDAVLSKVLVATDGPGNTLVIKSLIDGAFNANDLQMTVSGPAVNDPLQIPASEQATVLTAYKAFLANTAAANSAATIADAQAAQALSITNKNLVQGMDVAQVQSATSTGSISTAESDNTINLGAGDDVLVLGTGAFSNDRVVFTGYTQGKDTIVNFEDTVADSRDMLDFTAYLQGRSSVSGSAESSIRIATTLNADATVEANSVTVLNGAFTATQTFAGLTASGLLAAVNSTNLGAANYAGITAATLNAANGYTATGANTTLMGGVGKSVVLVQNNLNEGEYAVFELTFNGTLAANANADFTSAQLIGVVDFGNTVTFAANLLA